MIALTIANHSFDAVILFPKFVYNNTPFYTNGKKCQRFLNEYVTPLTIDAVYAVTCLYTFQMLGGTNEKGQPLYSAIDFKKDPVSSLILCAALAVGTPVVNKITFLISGAIQYGIHSPAGSVKRGFINAGKKYLQCIY